VLKVSYFGRIYEQKLNFLKAFIIFNVGDLQLSVWK